MDLEFHWQNDKLEFQNDHGTPRFEELHGGIPNVTYVCTCSPRLWHRSPFLPRPKHRRRRQYRKRLQSPPAVATATDIATESVATATAETRTRKRIRLLSPSRRSGETHLLVVLLGNGAHRVSTYRLAVWPNLNWSLSSQ